MIRLARRLAIALLLAGWPLAGAAAPCAGFSDVDDASGFCTSIAWMKNRAITLGCTATQYCPNDFVRRDQMAAFMYRLGFQNAFLNGGNAFGGTATLGTNDAQPLELRANGVTIARWRPNAVSADVVSGQHVVLFDALAVGQTVAGGGRPGSDCLDPTATSPSTRTCANASYDSYTTIGGGYSNHAVSLLSTIGGGATNHAAAAGATIAGGIANIAIGERSSVGGGERNRAFGTASAVPGGYLNFAGGHYAFAAGIRAQAAHHRSFVWGGSDTVDTQSQADGDFVVYAPTRIRLFAGTVGSGDCEVGTGNTGGNLSCSGTITAASFVPPSDRALKAAVVPVDVEDVLARVVAMPIAEWSYTATPGVRHMGPMGQDFHAAFGLGATDKGIATVDADGVALAAIQGLNAKLEARLAERDAKLAEQAREIDSLRRAFAQLLAERSR